MCDSGHPFVPDAFLVSCCMLSLKHLHNIETRFYSPQAFPSRLDVFSVGVAETKQTSWD